ncbi:hypothetical protein [Myceligenerans crystallogenes]|uniref:hypothetical protein n=1 Tax=Myceligenerans crystallogenes TaxID=316335 RepID=UPI0031DFA4D0
MNPTPGVPAPTTPAFSPDAHRLDLGRTGLLAVVVGTVLTGLLTWGCLTVVLDPSQGAARWVGVFFTLLFGGLTVLFLVGARRVAAPHGVVVDLEGIWFWHGKEWDLVRWTETARAGVSFELPPSMPSTSVQGHLTGIATDKAMELLKMTNKRRTALEITPASAGLFAAHPRLARYRKADPQPIQGLLAERWYVPAVPGYHSWRDLMTAGERFGGQVWTGFFQRPWGSIGTGWVQKP